MNRCLIVALVAMLIVPPAAAGDTPIAIAAVQFTTDPSGSSPLDGQLVTVQGIVYARYPGEGDPHGSFAMADAAGPWNGMYVYDSPTAVAVGDLVTVTGEVDEYYNLTELKPSVGGGSVVVNSSGNTPYGPSVVSTAVLATGATTAESYEGVFVEVQNVTVTDDDLGYGEWAVSDGSGSVRVNDLADYLCPPVLGEVLSAVRGMHTYSFDNFKIEPRSDADIGVALGSPTARTIPAIQGSGFASPHVNEVVTTTGVVTGFFEGNLPGFVGFDGFFVQDPTGDADPATSDGLAVLLSDLPAGLAAGDQVTVTGVVREFGEYDACRCADGCLTAVLSPEITTTGSGSAPTTTLTPPTDTDGELEYFERLEGMLVAINGPATVVGPTSFGAVFAVDADLGVDRVLRGGPHDGKPVAVRHWERYGEIGGGDPPSLIVGSVIDNVDGPLATTFGDYTVITQEGDAWSVGAAAPVPPAEPTWPEASGESITVGTLNSYNLDDGDADHLSKVVRTVVNMGCPTFLALQEVDTAGTATGQEDSVLPELITELGVAGCPYDGAHSHPDLGDHGVAVLWRSDQVSGVTTSTDYQGCSADGSTSSELYDAHCDALVDQYPLFSRRPVVVTATPDVTCSEGTPMPLTVVGNHFKSKLGGASADQRRLEQGQFVAALVDTLVAGGAERVVVVGDLNDFEDSPPLTALTATGPLDSLWDAVTADTRYSYNFNGVSQALDHVLYLPSPGATPESGAVFHIDADFPASYASDTASVWRTSDHDPLVATFDACGTSSLVFADGFESGDVDAWSAP
jgi:endonuclease/exonuclease/phosphatase family metal-dependent hydrolase